MSLSYKLIAGFIILALIMCLTSYLTIRSFNELKAKIVQLETDSNKEFKSSLKVIHAIEASDEIIKALVDNSPNIIFKYSQLSDSRNEIDSKIQIRESLINDLKKIEDRLASLIGPKFYGIQSNDSSQLKDPHKDSLSNRHMETKQFYYYSNYLVHFIYLVETLPENAPDFFKKTLEPYYEKNIIPLISRYRKYEKEEAAERLNNITTEYLPKVGFIIIISTMAILVSILLLGIGVSMHVFKPLNELAIAANKVGKGNFNTQLKVKRKDEIGALSNIFNNMIRDLRESTVSKNYMDNIVRSMLDTLIVANPDFTIRKVNQSAIQMLGYSQKELLGQPIDNIIFTVKNNISIIDMFNKENSIANIEMTYRTKEGLKIPVLFSGATFYNNDLQVDGIVCVAQNISDLKRIQANLKNAYEAMEHKVEKRTEELSVANKSLKTEIKERMLTEKALKDSGKKLRHLSSEILISQEKVRKQLSSELHDDLGQSLSLLKVKLSTIKNNTDFKNKQNDEILTEAQEYIDFIIESVRRLSRFLSPSIIEDLGLTAGLKWMFKDFSNHYKINTQVNIDNIDIYFSLDSQVIIYRIFQEFLNNVAKHSKADKINISIQKNKDRINFSMKDNGIGFNLKKVSSKQTIQKGIGLAAMEERALMLKSVLNIYARKGHGTKISYSIRRNKHEKLSNNTS